MTNKEEQSPFSDEKLEAILRNVALEKYTGLLTNPEEKQAVEDIARTLGHDPLRDIRLKAKVLFNATNHVYIARRIISFSLLFPAIWVIRSPNLIAWIVLIAWVLFAGWASSLSDTYQDFCINDIRDTLRRIEKSVDFLRGQENTKKE